MWENPLCVRLPPALRSLGPAQHSVPLSASRGHQSLHIARRRLLETKEEDFGCQFLLTSCKVCLEGAEAIYRLEPGCALFWLY